MLKKELCKQCWNTCIHETFRFDGWTKVDERIWKEGAVCCPSDYLREGEKSGRKTTDKPPLKCPYILEQVI